ncbi:hypothetical protein OAO01_09200 [Oligoflexia bacterium]|nr:hypothetical protein [Oligoflexia bacterium]
MNRKDRFYHCRVAVVGLTIVYVLSFFSVNAYAEVESLSMKLQCGVNVGHDGDSYRYTGVILNLSPEENEKAANTICDKKIGAFKSELEENLEAIENLECPSICNTFSSFNDNSKFTIFAFEITQHKGESYSSWIKRRARAIERAIELGECGETPEEHAECRRSISVGDFTLYICLSSWEYSWIKTCEGWYG